MSQNRRAGSALLVALALAGAAVSAGCSKDADDAVPVAESQTQRATDNLARNVTIEGCLRAGEGATTFVVTSSRAEQDGSTRTYALNYPTNAPPADLRDHVGRQVVVEGVVRAQDAVTGVSAPTPPANDPVGTGGAPRVQTTTALAVEQLEVNALRPLDEACPDR